MVRYEIQFVVVLVTVAVWLGVMWRSRRPLALGWKTHRGRTVGALLLVWILVLVGLVRPLTAFGVIGEEWSDFAWGLIRGMTLMLGLAYLWAGPPKQETD